MNDNTEDTEWLKNYPVLAKQSTINPFLVPDDYFEEQQERIRTAIFAQQLKDNNQPTGFTVPENYFETLLEQTTSVVGLEEMRSADAVFTVPNLFFEEQQNNILARIKIEEFAEQETEFSVPAGYFENLQDRIIQKTAVKEAQPTIKVRKLFVKAVWKYATAACIAIALTTGFLIKQHQTTHNIQTQLSGLPDADIENYLKINSDTYEDHIILETSASETDVNADINQGDTISSSEKTGL